MGLLYSCGNLAISSPGLSNRAPYPVSAAFTACHFKIGEEDNTFQILIDEQEGLKDPDGDDVVFRSSPLPLWISLEVHSGIVTVDTAAVHEVVTISFWSDDCLGGGTREDSIDIDISVFNNPPYPVTADYTSYLFDQGSGDNTFQLEILLNQGGLADPDGDEVCFKAMSLPAWVFLDEETGLVTVDVSELHGPETVSFWSEDEWGLKTGGLAFSVLLEVQ